MKTLAIFDFDGTITKKDTLLEFTKFSRGEVYLWIGMIILSPILILYKVKIIPNWKAKEFFLSYFFRGMTNLKFNQFAKEFCKEKLPGLIREKALLQIKENSADKNCTTLIATASAINWIKPWADTFNIQIVGTKLVKEDGILTGMILGKNCYGKEKLLAVQRKYTFSDYDKVIFFGDSRGDKVFKPYVDEFYYRYFE